MSLKKCKGWATLRGAGEKRAQLFSKWHATVQVGLIRSETPIKTFRGTLPLDIDYTDYLEMPGEKVYYRMDMTGYGAIVSNPIFVKFAK